MMENKSRLSRALVAGHGRDGRCRYDPEAKRELVEACLQPGVSVARMALEHGINANLLRKWIGLYHEVGHSDPNRSLALTAFASVLSLGAAQSAKPALNVTLPNGIRLELPSVALSDLSLILNALAELPCSASSRD